MNQDDRDRRDVEDLLQIATVMRVVEKCMEKKKRAKKRCWVRPWIERRSLPGRSTLSLLHYELAEEDPDSYKNFLRMDEPSFLFLLRLIDPYIHRMDTNMREAISSKDRLSLTLRFLATGETYKSLQFSTRIPASTISSIIPDVCQAIYHVLKDDYLKVPNTEDQWEKIAEDFLQLWNYPNCLGAMDGRHIAFQAPRASGSTYFNYKGNHSIILLALVDANYKFTYIDVGTNGRISDGGVYRECTLAEAIQTNALKIPEPRPLPGREIQMPYVIVADDAFTLTDHLMKPYPNRGLSIEERIHNYRLSRARRISENVFGHLANRFRVFLKCMDLSPEKVKIVTMAACALHNYLRTVTMATYMPVGSVDREVDGTIVAGSWRADVAHGIDRVNCHAANRVPRTAMAIRNEFKNYFNNEGAVPWQNDYIFNT